ncbi:hypothetical protein M885DRAFT_548069 [Pelagophyceae sp. CCMP2097]|nr:hypothetical protein M885DRAFT_548069 [Pelagophyceae sp. CCMP2097]
MPCSLVRLVLLSVLPRGGALLRPLRGGGGVRPWSDSAALRAVAYIQSTPNPNSFILRLDANVDGLGVSALRGRTLRPGDADAPPALAQLLRVDSLDSVYAMADAVTVNKRSTAAWERVLPLAVAALGGAAGDAVGLLGLLGGATCGASTGGSSNGGGVSVRLQVFRGLPLQVEAKGVAGVRRAKLPKRFSDAAAGAVGAAGDAFFADRSWIDKGTRYAEGDADADAPDSEAAVEAVLAAELLELEVAYPPARLEALASAALGGETLRAAALGTDFVYDLAAVEALCDADAAGDSGALVDLISATAAPSPAARRTAIAHLGGAGGRGGDAAFHALTKAFQSDLSVSNRRTAGDALSDVGDGRAAPFALAALSDASRLVRWRAARLCGEVAAPDCLGALAAREGTEKAFEVQFEIADAAGKIKARAGGAPDAGTGPVWKPGTGPVWKQIQDANR